MTAQNVNKPADYSDDSAFNLEEKMNGNVTVMSIIMPLHAHLP